MSFLPSLEKKMDYFLPILLQQTWSHISESSHKSNYTAVQTATSSGAGEEHTKLLPNYTTYHHFSLGRKRDRVEEGREDKERGEHAASLTDLSYC